MPSSYLKPSARSTSHEEGFDLCVGVIVLATAAWSQSTEKAIAALEDQWVQAQTTNNPDLLIPLLAEKFINTSDNGKVTGKSETIASYKQTKWTSAENTNVKVVVYGDTAIAIGTYKGKGAKERQGVRRSRAVDGYVDQDAQRPVAVRRQPGFSDCAIECEDELHSLE